MAKNPRSHRTSPRDVGRGHISSVDDFCSDRVQTIIRLRKEGHSLRQMAAVLGVTAQCIEQLIAKIERRHDVDLSCDSSGFVTLAEAARKLKLIGVRAKTLARRCGVLTEKRFGKWFIPTAKLPVMRRAYRSLFRPRCVICGAKFPKQHRWIVKYCSGRCRYVGQQKHRKKLDGVRPPIEDMAPWHRTLLQLFERRTPPKREQWLPLSQAVHRADATSMQLNWLRMRGFLRCRPHPTRVWRDGKPVHMYAASELDLVRKAKQKHGR